MVGVVRVAVAQSVVPKSVSPLRIAQNLQVFPLDPEDQRRIGELGSKNVRVNDPTADWGVDLFTNDPVRK